MFGSVGSGVNLAYGKLNVIAASVENMLKKINNIKVLKCLNTNSYSMVELTFNIIMSSSSPLIVIVHLNRMESIDLSIHCGYLNTGYSLGLIQYLVL